MHGAEQTSGTAEDDREAVRWIAEAAGLLKRGEERTAEAEYFQAEGHPWGCEIQEALATFEQLRATGADTDPWLESFKLRTTYWCAQVLGGAPPFPPPIRPRREDAATLLQRNGWE
ncbi:MAG: hypothetical protein AAFP69_21075 [Planctomycetota bacterium]